MPWPERELLKKMTTGAKPLSPSTHLAPQSRVLLLSHRNIAGPALFRCPHYEFEDIICQIDSADLVAPNPGPWFDVRSRLAKRVAWHLPLSLNPGIPRITINRHYDLLFSICNAPIDLLMLNAIENWDSLADVSICMLDQLWVTHFTANKHLLNTLVARFDCILLYYSGSVEPLARVIGRTCAFVPPGVDALLFNPYPQCPRRVIDIYSVGRRSEITHRDMIDFSHKAGLFYAHDTIAGSHAITATEHRAQYANTTKRSRYFLVNPALIDQPHVRGDQEELGNRYFEGAAAGTIMIGTCPRNPVFGELFNWPDAVIDLPYNSTRAGNVIRELDKDRERQETIRANNMTQTLLKHDWAYRWETILTFAGLPPLPALVERKHRLRQLATHILYFPSSRTEAEKREYVASFGLDVF